MTSVSLGDVLSRQVALAWSEAVAVVAELCAVLTRDGGSDAQVPDPMHILLTADGAVTIQPARQGASPGTTPGRLLHALLASSEPPAPLRLFVSVAISSDRYDSVATFAEALGYYEVPGRASLIQAAYRRAVSPAAAVPVSATPPPVPEQTAKASPVKTARAKVPAWAFAVGAVVLASAAAAALWFSGVVPSFPGATATPASETSVTDVELPRRRANAARGVTGAEPSAAVPGGPSTGDPGLPSPADSDPLVRLSDGPGVAFENTSAVPGEAATATTAPRGGAEPSGETVYSSASPEVQPPVAISPLPSAGRNPDLESIGTIELVVDEQGKVAQVRLVSQPSRMQPLMLLSAAKTWTFRPAVRDGQPVKYRLRVNVPATLP